MKHSVLRYLTHVGLYKGSFNVALVTDFLRQLLQNIISSIHITTGLLLTYKFNILCTLLYKMILFLRKSGVQRYIL